jgi:signal transduction histidine kinase
VQIPVPEVSVYNSRFFSGAYFNTLISAGKNLFTAEELANVFGPELALESTHYVFKVFPKFMLLIPVTSFNRLVPVIKEKQIEHIVVEADQRCTAFRLETKTRLIDSLFSSHTSLGDYVKAWAHYFFCDHYSLWIYNQYTEMFTCSASSFTYSKSFIARSENSSMNAVLEPGYVAECRAPNQNRTNHDQTRDMRTINRIKLDLGFDGTIGVLNFYSRHENFALNTSNHEELANSLETKYLQVRQHARYTMNEINQHYIESYKTGNLNQFLYEMSREICDKYLCEACSIYLNDADNQGLNLVALCDSIQSGTPLTPTMMKLSGTSTPIDEVFRSRRMLFSYDASAEQAEANQYPEKTEHPLRNWLVLPLFNGSTPLGVLRVCNKYELSDKGEKVAQNFRTSDIVNLSSLCANMADLIRIEMLFHENQRKLIETNAKMDEMRDFNRVFLHEIRTPISKFTLAPEIIKRSIRKKDLSDEAREKIIKQLDDIQVMGDRLEFITKTFNFNQIVTRRNFETLSVLGDIIFPVINITRVYLRKQYGIDIQLDADPLHSCRVYGDKTLLNIVFNTLIDNAGKYSIDTRKPITVSGGYEENRNFFRIQVSNYGLPIQPDEVAFLYDKGFRGKEAIKHRIEGTGIGLHLASRIMRECNGELLLTSTADPVTFVVRIPARPEGKET